jgi:hypothetical protein
MKEKETVFMGLSDIYEKGERLKRVRLVAGCG